MVRAALLVIAFASCTKVPGSDRQADPTNEPRDRDPGVRAPAPTPTPAPKATVTLTSVRFADDCGGTAPSSRPPAPPAPAKRAPPASVPAQSTADVPSAVYHCEQTSMQLSITATAATTVTIAKVEVFDQSGAALGALTASQPRRWSETAAAYETWTEQVAAGETVLASYVLSQPAFVQRYDARDRMYTVKVTASVGGVAQALQTTVMVVGRPAPMPT